MSEEVARHTLAETIRLVAEQLPPIVRAEWEKPYPEWVPLHVEIECRLREIHEIILPNLAALERIDRRIERRSIRRLFGHPRGH